MRSMLQLPKKSWTPSSRQLQVRYRSPHLAVEALFAEDIDNNPRGSYELHNAHCHTAGPCPALFPLSNIPREFLELPIHCLQMDQIQFGQPWTRYCSTVITSSVTSKFEYYPFYGLRIILIYSLTNAIRIELKNVSVSFHPVVKVELQWNSYLFYCKHL